MFRQNARTRIVRGGRSRASLPRCKNLDIWCVWQAGRDEGEHVDEAQAILDAKASHPHLSLFLSASL